MPNANSTYDANGTLRTVTEAGDPTMANLGRELLTDRRSDYDTRRANRGTERPVSRTGGSGGGGGYAAPPPPPAAFGSDHQNIRGLSQQAAAAQARSAIAQANAMMGPAPTRPMADLGNTSGPYHTMDPGAMNAFQRQAFLAQNSQIGAPVGPTDDPGWLQFLAMTQHRRNTDDTINQGQPRQQQGQR